jgi:hypothetical protein
MTTRAEFLTELTDLAKRIIPTIAEDDHALDFTEEDPPSVQVTIGANADGWNYQTGDNSFYGAAYNFAAWGVAILARDSDPAEFAREILQSLERATPDDAVFFYECTDSAI